MPEVSPSAQACPDDATRLRTVREMLGLSQRAFAGELGVAPSALAQWETARGTPPGPILRLLSLYEEQLRITAPEAPLDPSPRPPRLERSRAARTASTAFAAALWAMLAKTPARPGASSFERRIRSAAIDSYVRTLGELRGLGLKLGQLLANIDALDTSLFSAETRIDAATLQAKPMGTAAVVDVFLREMKRAPREIFAEWSTRPMFAASIGQVHEAKLRTGERVAVKVQYPAAAETLALDLRNVELLDRLFCAIAPSQRPGAFYAELAERFTEECDYARERENTKWFARYFAGHDAIVVPGVFEAFSTSKILTTELATGEALGAFARRAGQAERDRAGQTIWEFFNAPAQQAGIFHADPHAGNLLFRGGAVTFLDFGRVGRMSASFLEGWQRLVRAIFERDRAGALTQLERLDLVRQTPASSDDLYRATLANVRPWLSDGPFAFDGAYARSTWDYYTLESVRSSVNVPRDAALWNQLTYGVFALLAPLRCRVNCREPMLQWLYGADARRPAPYTRAELAELGLDERFTAG